MKKLSRSKIVKKLDSVFSQYIRLRDCDKDGFVVCPLCGAKVERKKAQNMHFISRACMQYRYDEMNCHAGCMRCNVILNGNYIIYTRRMQEKYGIETVDRMIFTSKQVYKISTPELETMIQNYSLLNKKIAERKGLSG